MPKTAIITGGTGGIGREIISRLAAEGFAVVVGYTGNADKAKETIDAVNAGGGSAIAVQGDVAKAEDVAKLFAESKKAFGSIDVVVHIAGSMSYSPIAKGDVDQFDKTIATNLRGTFLILS
jgi:3-oxoacyl-[acyl-carrier protein] reductase